MSQKKKSTTSNKKATKEPTFEQALKRLETLVEQLEDGEIPLEQSLKTYAEGTALVKLCLARLENAETMIRELNEDAEGFHLTPSDLDDDEGGGPGDDQKGKGSKQNDLAF